MSDKYIYLFIREDLSKPQQIIQTAHAVDGMNFWAEKEEKISNMVLFSLKNEEDLIKTSNKLMDEGISHELFYEPDISAYTAIATQPLVGNERKPMKRFRLMI